MVKYQMVYSFVYKATMVVGPLNLFTCYFSASHIRCMERSFDFGLRFLCQKYLGYFI